MYFTHFYLDASVRVTILMVIYIPCKCTSEAHAPTILNSESWVMLSVYIFWLLVFVYREEVVSIVI